MNPAPRHALVVHLGQLEVVVRLSGLVLFLAIGAGLDFTFLPRALPHAASGSYHVTALIITALMILATIVHEGGHAAACLLQGLAPVRITMRGTGAACAAIVSNDTAPRALTRALAGPAVTACVVGLLIGLTSVGSLHATWRVVVTSLMVFSLFDLVFNTLPVHPACDGTHALRALLWMVRGREPDRQAVLYVWRPVILAMAVLALPLLADRHGHVASGPTAVAATLALALCAVPLWAIVALVTRPEQDHIQPPAPVAPR